MFIKSMTSGNKLPAKELKRSFFRRLLFLPHIYIEYQAKGLQGFKTVAVWLYPSEIFD